jgi:chromosome segregation ATPase
MIIDQMREADRIEYMENLLNLERITLESVTKQRDEVRADLEFRRGLFQVQEQQLNEVRAERDEWKAKHIQQNKDLGCEMMDPAGTIWDYASATQRENVQLKREVVNWKTAHDIAIEQRDRAQSKIENQAERIKYLEGATNHATGTPLSKMREQRDRLAEALREIKSELGVPQPEYPAPVANAFKIADEALAAVKGGKP